MFETLASGLLRCCKTVYMARSWLSGLLTALSGSRTTVLSGSEDETQLYAATLLAETREEIDRADSKASILLASTGIAVGALLAGLLSRSWAPTNLRTPYEFVWWAGVAAAAVGIWNLAYAVYPRTRRRGKRPDHVGYYGDVLSFDNTTELSEALHRSADVKTARLADQLYQLSLIVDRKYRSIRRAMWCLLAAIGSCATAVTLNAFIR